MSLNFQFNLGNSPQPFMGGPFGAGAMAGAGGGMPQMMMQMMQMMQTMMGMMQQMSGGRGFPMGPGQFGNPGNCGGFQGNPFGNFLGNQGCGCGPGGGGFPMGGGAPMGGGFPSGGACGPGGMQGGQGPGPMGPIPGGPSGQVGNVDVNRVVAVLPQNLQQSARQHFPFIVAEAQKQGVQNKAQLAYILATATHESNAGKNMEEFASGRAYEGRGDLGNSQPGDGTRYKGRGYVQLTGRRNYADWSRRLGMDLVGNPQMVQNPEIAAKILVGGMMQGTFTGKGLGNYINNQQTDFNGARRTVNGTDRAGHIAGIAQRIMSAL